MQYSVRTETSGRSSESSMSYTIFDAKSYSSTLISLSSKSNYENDFLLVVITFLSDIPILIRDILDKELAKHLIPTNLYRNVRQFWPLDNFWKA